MKQKIYSQPMQLVCVCVYTLSEIALKSVQNTTADIQHLGLFLTEVYRYEMNDQTKLIHKFYSLVFFPSTTKGCISDFTLLIVLICKTYILQTASCPFNSCITIHSLQKIKKTSGAVDKNMFLRPFY